MGGPSLTRRALLASAALAALLPRPAAAQSAVPSAWRPSYGWDPGFAAPETADVIVAPDGDDAAPGTLEAPLRSLRAGVAALARRGGGSLGVRGGIYREAVDLDALRGTPEAPFRLHRFGAERVTISACEPLADWRPLSAAEALAQGLPEGRVWRAELPRAALPAGGAAGLSLWEAGVWCPQATWRADPSDPARLGDPATYWRAPAVATDAEGRLLEIRDPRLAQIPPAALARARLLVLRRPSFVSRVVPGRGSGGAVLDLSEAGLHAQKIDGAPGAAYALQNVAAGMAPGHWMEGPGTTDRVVEVLHWPRGPAGPEAMEYAARDHCIAFGRAAHVTLLGLEAVGAAGPGRYAGVAIRRPPAEGGGAGLVLRHCRAAGVQAFETRGYGAIALSGCTGLTIENVTVEDTHNAVGLFVHDSRDVAMSGLRLAGVSSTPGRFFGMRDAVLSFSLLEDGGQDIHSNHLALYEGCDRVLVYGLRVRRMNGYTAYQEASRIHFAFCEIAPGPEGNGRALVSQNRRPGAGQGGPDGSGAPVPASVFFYWNNTLQPDRPDPRRANALVLGPGGATQRHAFFNNLLHGGGVPDIYAGDADPRLERRSHNRYSGTAFWQAEKYGWRPTPTETLGGAAGLGLLRGRDMRDVIAELAPQFPRFARWDVDIDGTPVDWSAAPIGCRVI